MIEVEEEREFGVFFSFLEAKRRKKKKERERKRKVSAQLFFVKTFFHRSLRDYCSFAHFLSAVATIASRLRLFSHARLSRRRREGCAD